jgi:putative transposase
MRKPRYTDSQILAILKQSENGVAVPDLCREHGMSSAQFYKWRAKFSGMDASMMKRLKELEVENKRLKKMYAEERIKAEIRKEALEGKL